MNGDGRADIITGTGPGGGPLVKVYDGRTGSLLKSLFAFDQNFRGGVLVAAGDVNGDGKADIVAGQGPGGSAMVKVFDATSLAQLGGFNATSTGFAGGLRVGTADVNGDGRDDVLVGSGSGSWVRAFHGTTGATLRDGTAFDPSFLGGVFIG